MITKEAELIKKQKERWIVFSLVFVFILIPLVSGVRMKPASMKSSQSLYGVIDELKPEDNKIVLVALDWGSGTSAENEPQSKLIIEHLLRKRIPFALVTLYNLAAPFLDKLPKEVVQKLQEEDPSQSWEYGKDWVNLGFLPNGTIQVQALSKSQNWKLENNFKTDAYNTPVNQIPLMEKITNIKDISALVEITGLVGLFSTWLQFFQTENYTPKMLHGCTSITIPEAFIYFSSGQLKGFFEGIAGAAYYEFLLEKDFPNRNLDFAKVVNTGTSFAQILVLILICVGNAMYFINRKKGAL